MAQLWRAPVFLTAAALLLLSACGGDDDGTAAPDTSPAPDAALDATADSSSPVVDAGPALGGTGAACVSDGDCRAGLTCFLGPDGARAWLGGYCTRECAEDADCPAGALCGPAYFEGDAAHLLCLASCDREAGSRGGCRDGYRCHYDGACRLGCSSDLECQRDDTDPGPVVEDPEWSCDLSSSRCVHEGNREARALDACTDDPDCRPPRGSCNGGVCYQPDCDLGGEHACAAGEVCVRLYVGRPRLTSMCWPVCDPAVDGRGDPADACRGGPCWPREKDVAGEATSAFCVPGAVITGGDTPIGGACATTADCRNPHGYVGCIEGVCVGAYCAAPSLAELDVCDDPNAVCLVQEPAGDSWDHERMLGLCLRGCRADPTVCDPSTSCQEGVCL